MGVSRELLLTIGGAYLALLVVAAWLVERHPAARELARHPLVHALALGVFASSWTYYGSFGFAQRHGLVFLAVYLGPTLAMLLTPFVLRPLLALMRRERLASLADLLAFRYRSRTVGLIVAAALVTSSLPYIAQQIRAVTESVGVLVGAGSESIASIAYCAFVAFFACVFGLRRGTRVSASEGLLAALAIESLVKLAAFLTVGLVAVAVVFGGPSGLSSYAAAHPDLEEALSSPVQRDEGFTSLLLLSLGAFVLLPRQFYLLFHPRIDERRLRTASLVLPAYLLLLTLPVVPVLLAAHRAGTTGPADFTSILLPRQLGFPIVALFTFVGGLSASSAMILVTVLALVEILVSHVVLPAELSAARILTEERVFWLRRLVAVAIVVAGFAAYLVGTRGPLVESAIPCFIAVSQFVPALVGVLFWRRATRTGVVWGLGVGLVAWLLLAQLPALLGPSFAVREVLANLWHASDEWTLPAFVSIAANGFAFVVVSLSTKPGPEEREAASRCVGRAHAGEADVAAFVLEGGAFEHDLAELVGEAMAQKLVRKATATIGVPLGAMRPLELARLREEVRRGLSETYGPVVARIIVDERLRNQAARLALVERLVALEGEAHRSTHDHTARQIDVLRRYLRAVLDSLPVAVCALGADGAVVLTNEAMERLADLEDHQLRGARPADLGEPWATLLVHGEAGECIVDIGRDRKVLVVSRSVLDGAVWGEPGTFGAAVLIEDRTQQRSLEAQVAHADRLSVLGRLAAGVAHEIGNPLTAIAFVAQNALRDTTGGVRFPAEAVLAQTERIESIVRSLLRYSRDDMSALGSVASSDDAFGPVQLDRLVDEALALVLLDRSNKRARSENLLPSTLRPWGRRLALLQVLVNLLTNAFDASQDGALVVVDGFEEADMAVLRIVDTGTGIPQDLLSRVGDPFFTTKSERGTGLGLSLVKRLVEEHRGTIEIESEVGVGTTVIVTLPLSAAPSSSARLEKSTSATHGDTGDGDTGDMS